MRFIDQAEKDGRQQEQHPPISPLLPEFLANFAHSCCSGTTETMRLFLFRHRVVKAAFCCIDLTRVLDTFGGRVTANDNHLSVTVCRVLGRFCEFLLQ